MLSPSFSLHLPTCPWALEGLARVGDIQRVTSTITWQEYRPHQWCRAKWAMVRFPWNFFLHIFRFTVPTHTSMLSFCPPRWKLVWSWLCCMPVLNFNSCPLTISSMPFSLHGMYSPILNSWSPFFLFLTHFYIINAHYLIFLPPTKLPVKDELNVGSWLTCHDNLWGGRSDCACVSSGLSHAHMQQQSGQVQSAIPSATLSLPASSYGSSASGPGYSHSVSSTQGTMVQGPGLGYGSSSSSSSSTSSSASSSSRSNLNMQSNQGEAGVERPSHQEFAHFCRM